MEEKAENSKSKKRLIAFVCILLASTIALVGAVTLVYFSKINTVSIYDNSNKLIAVATINGNDIEIDCIKEETHDYVEACLYESISIYSACKNLEYQEAKSKFFIIAKSIETNLEQPMLERIVQAYKNSSLSKQASFAAALTTTDGRLVASYGIGTDNNTTYSLKKTYAGSCIKPLSIFAPGIESGKFNWSTMVIDAPVKKIKNEYGEKNNWPVNSDNIYSNKNMILCDALIQSKNTCAVRLLQKLGVKKSLNYLENNFKLNLDNEKEKINEYGDDEVLGNIGLGYLYNGVSVIDLSGFYEIFANGGEYIKPYAVKKITKLFGTLYEAKFEPKQVLSLETAQIMNELLKKVVTVSGTGSEAYVPKLQVGGKTGTTSNNADNWFTGFIPGLTCSVWHSSNASYNQASKIFADIVATIDCNGESYPTSNNIIYLNYCKKTGKKACKNCKDVAGGYYYKMHIPQECKECN